MASGTMAKGGHVAEPHPDAGVYHEAQEKIRPQNMAQGKDGKACAGDNDKIDVEPAFWGRVISVFTMVSSTMMPPGHGRLWSRCGHGVN
jgi:hypothetical protein